MDKTQNNNSKTSDNRKSKKKDKIDREEKEKPNELLVKDDNSKKELELASLELAPLENKVDITLFSSEKKESKFNIDDLKRPIIIIEKGEKIPYYALKKKATVEFLKTKEKQLKHYIKEYIEEYKKNNKIDRDEKKYRNRHEIMKKYAHYNRIEYSNLNDLKQKLISRFDFKFSKKGTLSLELSNFIKENYPDEIK